MELAIERYDGIQEKQVRFFILSTHMVCYSDGGLHDGNGEHKINISKTHVSNWSLCVISATYQNTRKHRSSNHRQSQQVWVSRGLIAKS